MGGGKLHGGLCMIAICTIDGLTTGGKLLRVGEFFALSEHFLKEVEGKTDEQVARWQLKVYKKSIFRRPTPEELADGLKAKKFNLADCEQKEKTIIGRFKMQAAEREKRAAAVLMGDLTEDVEIGDELKMAVGKEAVKSVEKK